MIYISRTKIETSVQKHTSRNLYLITIRLYAEGKKFLYSRFGGSFFLPYFCCTYADLARGFILLFFREAKQSQHTGYRYCIQANDGLFQKDVKTFVC